MACAELMQAQSLRHTNKPGAIELLNSVVQRDLENCDENEIKNREQAVMELGRLLFETKQAKELAGLIKFTRPFLNMISKAKAAKLVRGLVDMFLDMEAGTGSEVELCKECIMWAKDEKRTFLRQALEVRLISLYFDTKNYSGALQLASQILRELKKIDDKALLVEVHLLESKIYHALGNLPRARAALTSARTTANGIYCPPKLQAALDLQSGVLHAADERDFKTAFSYFYEAFEGYDSIDSPKAVTALKYMVLAKIMMTQADEVPGIVGGKLALKYSGVDITAMKAIAQASSNRSLAEFQAAKKEFKAQLLDDPIVKAHLDTLYDSLLENNLCRIIEPFSRVQMGHIAKIIKLGKSTVEKKLSQMILDRKFQGILDQAEGILIIFDDVNPDKTYENALNTINNMSKVVDVLYSKTKKLT